jgi:hypothetical protein
LPANTRCEPERERKSERARERESERERARAREREKERERALLGTIHNGGSRVSPAHVDMAKTPSAANLEERKGEDGDVGPFPHPGGPA